MLVCAYCLYGTSTMLLMVLYDVCTYVPTAFSPCIGKVVALRFNKEFVDSVSGGQWCGVLLDQTNFYAEQGGQLYDTGFMTKVDDEVRDSINMIECVVKVLER